MFFIHSIISVASYCTRTASGFFVVGHVLRIISVFHLASAFGSDMPSCLVVMIGLLLESGLLVLDGDVGTSGGLPLLADEVGDLLVLGLLDGGFVVLEDGQYETLCGQQREDIST